MNNEEARQAIEEYAKIQEAQFGCPRCGKEMKEKLHTNALSRQIDIMVCDRCGIDEALIVATGRPHLPFEQWAINLLTNEQKEHAELCASLNIQIAMLKKIERDEKAKFDNGVTKKDVEELRNIVKLLNDAVEIKTGQRVGE